MTYLDNLYDKREGLGATVEGILTRAANEGREMTDDERTRVEAINVECRGLDNAIADVEKMEDGRAKFAEMAGRRAERAEREERARGRDAEAKPETTEGGNKAPALPRTYGQRVIESPEFKAFQGTGTSGKISLPGLLTARPRLVEARAAITTGDLDVPVYTYDGLATPPPLTPLLNAVGHVRTSSGSVEYLTWDDASAAQEVAEGDLKPEASITPTPTALSLTTYAHWKAITRQALEDVPQIQSIVDNKLRQGLLVALDDAAADAINNATLDETAIADLGGLSGAIRTAMGVVEAKGYRPNTVLLNPADFAALDVSASVSANAGPVAPSTYWGLTPIASSKVDEGTAYVGDFSQGVTWFDRGDEAVYLTDSHSDYFVRNLLVILAEIRGAFAVTEPAALAKVTVTPTEPVTAKASK